MNEDKLVWLILDTLEIIFTDCGYYQTKNLMVISFGMKYFDNVCVKVYIQVTYSTCSMADESEDILARSIAINIHLLNCIQLRSE